MEQTTISTYLMYSSDDGLTYTKVMDITNYPDLGTSPTKIDLTTMTDTKNMKNTFGLTDAPDFVFEGLFTQAELTTLYGLVGTQYKFQVQFGVDGANGTITWDGQINPRILGAGVNEARKMAVDISVESDIVFA